MTETPPFRRLVYRHTRGPWAGIDQIVGVITAAGGFYYFTTGEARSHVGPVPDVLAPVKMSPDWRVSCGSRLKTTDKYCLYLETEPQ